MIVYFETSALVKLVIAEQGSEDAGALWDAADGTMTSRLSYAEARAALAAARRSGRLSTPRLVDAKEALKARFREIDMVEVTAGIVRSAGDLAEQHALRGYDAVHLASVLAFDSPDLVLATWDRRLAASGRASGVAFAGIRPE